MYVKYIYAIYIYTYIYICKILKYTVYTACLCVYTREHAERKILRTWKRGEPSTKEREGEDRETLQGQQGKRDRQIEGP